MIIEIACRSCNYITKTCSSSLYATNVRCKFCKYKGTMFEVFKVIGDKDTTEDTVANLRAESYKNIKKKKWTIWQ